MNNITLTVELCAEDRARLDKISERLEAQITLTEYLIANGCGQPKQADPLADVKEALAKAVEEAKPALDKIAETAQQAQEAAKNAQDALDASTPTEKNTPESTEDAPAQPTEATEASIQAETEENPIQESASPSVTLEQLRQKVLRLASADNGAKKVQVRDVVRSYAPTVSDLPADKWDEVYAKLKALEG